MKSTVSVIMLIFAFSVLSFGQMTPVGPKSSKVGSTKQAPVKVNPLALPDGYDAGQVSGDIKEGVRLASLKWAERSSVACFPGTRFEQFNGNHVFYRITLPAASSMTVELVPKDNAKINLYALRQGMRAQTVPPNVTSAISCEASYPIYANLPGGRRVQNKDKGRNVSYISVNSSYSILIGVAGSNGLTEGEFDLKIQIKSR